MSSGLMIAYFAFVRHQVQMIIKGIFRRYERWNPVHPTYGAFWGMGIGIGCGVGWGPGFGPEVVGYVGAGCGAGFSVGFTLAGLGIGLPMNGLFAVPFNGMFSHYNLCYHSFFSYFGMSSHFLSLHFIWSMFCACACFA